MKLFPTCRCRVPTCRCRVGCETCRFQFEPGYEHAWLRSLFDTSGVSVPLAFAKPSMSNIQSCVLFGSRTLLPCGSSKMGNQGVALIPRLNHLGGENHQWMPQLAAAQCHPSRTNGTMPAWLMQADVQKFPHVGKCVLTLLGNLDRICIDSLTSAFRRRSSSCVVRDRS